MSNHYDLLVIGAGSGGLATARRAASYGAKAAVAERGPIGGTCVNLGCVPKKVMWFAAQHAEMLHDHKDYGFKVNKENFDMAALKKSRDAYIQRLHGIYNSNLEREHVDYLVTLYSSDLTVLSKEKRPLSDQIKWQSMARNALPNTS